ncbi:RHS repeat-associated core domain-containing protein [Bordetella bronchialis]|uniref:RHS repeat-associated core domain-containing protein n=1 Tax=Bordetella bronchialis TaxID=463025 RepID=A0ABN4R1K2_9BORD|nr:RHS repeat-associated core domain-containing protein [Bordetella bronchialis]ANN66339.1 hypothetical protein BAU06_08605 [Bordetella bronchialis]
MAPLSCLRYGSYRHDPLSGGYPLGHGHRMYLPGLMRFSRPDPLSPFGAGGLHPYAYCAGDPIDHTDPRGAFPVVAVAALIIASLDVASVMRSARKAVNLFDEARGLTGMGQRRARALAALHATSVVSTTSGALVGVITAVMGFSAPDGRNGSGGWLSGDARDLLWLTVALSAVGGVAGGAAHIMGKAMPHAAAEVRPVQMAEMPYPSDEVHASRPRRPSVVTTLDPGAMAVAMERHRWPVPVYDDIMRGGESYDRPPAYPQDAPRPASPGAPPPYSVQDPLSPSPPPDDPAPTADMSTPL